MTHPARADVAATLRENHPELDLRIVMDPEPDQPPWVVRTFREGWQAADRSASHHLLLQDDVLLCEDFALHLNHAVRSMPHAAISLFADWSARNSAMVRLAALTGASWAPVIGRFAPTQGMVLPSDVAASLVEYLSNGGAIPGEPEDITVLRFFKSRGIQSVIAVPNIVEHRDIPSIAGNTDLGLRLSACFSNPLSADHEWNSEVLNTSVVPYLRWDTGEACCLVESETGKPWDFVKSRPWLTQHGMTAEVLLAPVLRDRQVSRLLSCMSTDIEPRFLEEIALVGVLTALVAKDLGHCSRARVSPQPKEWAPIAGQALDSLAPGMLRSFLDMSVIDEHRSSLNLLTRRSSALGSQTTWPRSALGTASKTPGQPPAEAAQSPRGPH
ncbi:hypothetical protein [Streptomyces sp. NPDC002602]|uniref:hypothetical protein n=1 Tax=Streptomyces sp. NPDC002602 TaxID=3364654 RepID=UPI0036C8B580